MFKAEDTICAPATVPGSGAIAIVRISGPRALEAIDGIVNFKSGTALSSSGYSLKYGSIEGLDDVMVSLYRNPHSYTGEDSAEISCHASAYIVSSILERLISRGLRMAEPGEFTRRAFLNGKMDLAQAEAVADVIASGSEISHRVALNQLRGGYSNKLRGLRDQLLELSALMELELDFSEEDVEFADRNRLISLLDYTLSEVDHLAASFKAGNALRNGIPVAIVGAANAGKSTLLNALLGEDRAIVSDIAGTTRDTVEEVFVIDGLQYRLIDTAGLRETSDEVEKLGISRSHEAIKKADVVIAVLDGGTSDETLHKSVLEIAAETVAEQKVIYVLNKIDLADSRKAEKLKKIVAESIKHWADGMVLISAKQGTGLNQLRTAISATQKDRFNTEDTLVTNLRHYQALCSASGALRNLRQGLTDSIPTDLLTEDLRASISSLSSIWGESLGITAQETLNLIFRKHCIGK